MKKRFPEVWRNDMKDLVFVLDSDCEWFSNAQGMQARYVLLVSDPSCPRGFYSCLSTAQLDWHVACSPPIYVFKKKIDVNHTAR